MIKITSHMMKTLWTPIVFFIVLLTAFLMTLLNGISIKSIELPGIRVDGLYIKLDKKLILEAKSIEIARNSQKESSREELITLLDQLPWLDRLFSSIQINNIHFDDEDIKILYKDDVFYIDSNYLTVDAKLSAREADLSISISQLLFKDFSLELKGNVTANLKKDTAFFKGSFDTFDIQGNLAVRLENDMVFYVADSKTFKNLTPFMEHLEEKVNMEPEVGEWVYKKIKASSYTLTSLEGQIDLRNGDFFPYKMKGKAHIKDAVVTFHPDVKPAHIHEMDVILKNNQLDFDLKKAEYQGIDVTNSNIYLYNILTNGNGIVLNIHASTLLNEKIHPILKAYKINLPISQLSGSTDAVFKLDIRFVPYDLDAKGYFIVRDSNLKISNAPMYSKYAEIELNNYLITLKKTNLQYEGLFDIEGEGTFNTRTGKFHGNLDIDRLHVGFGETSILDINNISTPTIMEITKDALNIDLKALNANLFFGEGENRITQDKLSLLYATSALMQKNGLKEGQVTVNTKDFANFDIDLHVSDATLPLVDGILPLKALDLKIQASKDALKAQTKDKRIALEVEEDTTKIDLSGYDVIVTEDNSSSSSALEIKGHSSNLFIKDLNRTVLTDYYDVTKKEGHLLLKANYQKGKLSLSSDDKHLQIDASHMEDTFINTLAQKEVFENGTFALTLYGNDTKHFSGNFHIDDSYLKDMRVYNNILSLINTLPALASFKGPDFDEKGYRITKADILFSRLDNIITLHAIDIDGTTADISGTGTVDLSTDALNIDLQLTTLKDVSKLIEKIPGVNYILLGEDKSISTAIAVRGTLQKPEVKTQVLQETVITPFNILKRTIQLPFKIFTD